MENDIKFLRIQNFKSLKDVTLHPRRVNLIIGEPNVGKSNLLEAMTLLGGITYEQTEKFMGSFIRYEEPRQLFYDNLVGNTIKVETDRDVAIIAFFLHSELFRYLLFDKKNLKTIAEKSIANNSVYSLVRNIANNLEYSLKRNTPEQIDQELNSKFTYLDDLNFFKFVYMEFKNHPDSQIKSRAAIKNLWLTSPPKSYTFHKKTSINNDSGRHYLAPPFGSNLIEVIQTHSHLRQEIASMFERYGQKLQLRMDERKLEIIKDQDGIIYSYPYSSVADTLQRIIFYLAAIESNDDAVLLFEEPEAHSFPVYVSKLGRRIVESRNNQFFIDTHSPYLITEILETMLTDDAQAGELAMFAAYYEDHQTKVHQLSDEEIRSIRNDGIDVFYNMKRFTTGAASNA